MRQCLRQSRRPARSERLDVRSSQRLTADRPVSALELIDADPGYGAHGLAFYLDHRFGDLVDEFPLLCLRENVLDYIDSNEWHIGVSSRSVSRLGPFNGPMRAGSHARFANACRFPGEFMEMFWRSRRRELICTDDLSVRPFRVGYGHGRAAGRR